MIVYGNVHPDGVTQYCTSSEEWHRYGRMVLRKMRINPDYINSSEYSKDAEAFGRSFREPSDNGRIARIGEPYGGVK